MAFDGGFLHTVTTELKQAVGCHVDKIYQPSRDILILQLRKKGFVKRLVLSAASGTSRVHYRAKIRKPRNAAYVLYAGAKNIFLGKTCRRHTKGPRTRNRIYL